MAFYSGGSVRSPVEQEGFEFFGFERVDEERAFRNLYGAETRGPRAGGGRRLVRILRDWRVETIPAQLADLNPLLDRWRPDVIATDPSLWSPIVVLHESQPIPVAVASAFMGPVMPGPDAPPRGFGFRPPRGPVTHPAARAATALTEIARSGVRRRVDEIRAGHGLAALGESVERYTARLPLYLVGNIGELDYQRQDLPFTVHYVGHCNWRSTAPRGAAEWLKRVPTDRPWVHVGEVTPAPGDEFLLRAAARGLASEPVEVIITMGRGSSSDVLGLGAAPRNVHLSESLPDGDLLARCSAVVTAGANSTILDAIEAGAPLVIVPTNSDKRDNARRVTEAGAGVRLAPRRCTPKRLRGAVRTLLGEPSYRRRARSVGARLAAAPGPAGAAELLEALACRHDGADTGLRRPLAAKPTDGGLPTSRVNAVAVLAEQGCGVQ